MTGRDLHQLIVDKWGYSYDVQLGKFKGKPFVQIMWKYLEQVSFPLSEAEYFAHLEAIAQYLDAWGAQEQVRAGVAAAKHGPRVGKAVAIAIDLSHLGDRAAEWLLD